MPRVWRLCREPYVALDGEGARRYGARWSSPGVPVVYMAEHLSLSALEYLVHVDVADVPTDLVALAIDVPDDAPARTVAEADLPADWRDLSTPSGCREIGDAWAEAGEALLLRVPSVLVPEESNVLLNPRHPRAGAIAAASTRPFVFDPRLL